MKINELAYLVDIHQFDVYFVLLATMTAFQSFSRYSLPIENYQFFPAHFEEFEETANEKDGEETKETITRIYHDAFEIAAMVFVAAGIISNSVNVIVLTRPNLKGTMYIYLLALAATNLVSLILAIPTLLKLAEPFQLPTYSSFALAIFVAHIEIPLLNIFIGASTYIIIFSTINLFIAVYKPTCFRDMYTNRNAYLHISISFILNAFLILPHIFMSYFHEVCLDDDNEDIRCPKALNLDEKNSNEDKVNFIKIPHQRTNISECTNIGYVVCVNKHYDNGLKIYTYISSFILRLGPIGFITIMTILIIFRFNKLVRRRKEQISRQNLGDPQSGEEDFYTPEERRMVYVLIGIAVTFVICNTPAAMLTILFIKNQESFSMSVDYAIFRSIANNLELIGLCLNLVIYCLCSRDIRKAYIDVIFHNRLVKGIRNLVNDRESEDIGRINTSDK